MKYSICLKAPSGVHLPANYNAITQLNSRTTVNFVSIIISLNVDG